MSGKHPSFTPFLLANPVLRNVPEFVVQRICNHAMNTMFQRHPSVFSRVTERETFAVLIAPTDLDLRLYLKLDPARPELRPAKDSDEEQVAARITGPLPALLDLLQGKSDGDALFFSRTLRIEGRTDLVVALRNALDADDIDLRAAVIDSFGMTGPLTRIALAFAERIYHQLQRDMARAADCLISPAEKRLTGLEKRIKQQSETVAKLEKNLHRNPRYARTGNQTRNATKDDFALPDHP